MQEFLILPVPRGAVSVSLFLWKYSTRESAGILGICPVSENLFLYCTLLN
jgi:hypothetical protein